MPSLASVFLFLAVVGGAVGILQALGALIGMGEDHSPEGHGVDAVHHAAAANEPASPLGVFNFRSVRAIAAGIGFTGLGGMLALREFSEPVALVLALLLGLALYLFVAFVMRGFSRLEADHSVHPLRAVGLEAIVSLPIPVRGSGPGKVTLVVAGRRVEWPAIQSDGDVAERVIPSGTSVHVIDAADDTTLTVVPLPHRS
jgi:hypothetical protein